MAHHKGKGKHHSSHKSRGPTKKAVKALTKSVGKAIKAMKVVERQSRRSRKK